MAQHIKTDGTVTDVTPANGKKFTLQELQGFVGGLIELIELGNGRLMFCHEESKLVAEPKSNLLANLIIYKINPEWCRHDYVAGDVLVCSELEANGEEDE